jgi:hypothetical protein
MIACDDGFVARAATDDELIGGIQKRLHAFVFGLDGLARCNAARSFLFSIADASLALCFSVEAIMTHGALSLIET